MIDAEMNISMDEAIKLMNEGRSIFQVSHVSIPFVKHTHVYVQVFLCVICVHTLFVCTCIHNVCMYSLEYNEHARVALFACACVCVYIYIYIWVFDFLLSTRSLFIHV